MTSPDDLNTLNKLETANYATLTEEEKYTFRNVDFNDGTLAEAAGKMKVNVNGEDMTVDDLGKKIYELAKDTTFTTHAEVKEFLRNNGFGEIDKTPITGKLQGATAAGIDFRFGLGTMTALKAKYSAPVEKPVESPISVESTDMKGKNYSDIMKDILEIKLPIDSVPNCKECFDTLRILGYVTPQDTLKNVVFMPVTDTLIFQNTGTPMVVSMKGIYNMVGGYMKKINGPLLVQRITDAFEKVSASVAEKTTKEIADKSKEMALQFGKDLSYRKERFQDVMNGFNVPDIMSKLIADPNNDSTIDTVRSSIERQSATLRYNRDQLIDLSDRVTKSEVLEPTRTNILNDIAATQKIAVNEIAKRERIGTLLADYKIMKNEILALSNSIDLGMKLPIDQALAKLRLVPSTMEKYRKKLANSMNKIAVPCDKAWNTDWATKVYKTGNKMLTDIENRVKNKVESNGLPYSVMSTSA